MKTKTQILNELNLSLGKGRNTIILGTSKNEKGERLFTDLEICELLDTKVICVRDYITSDGNLRPKYNMDGKMIGKKYSSKKSTHTQTITESPEDKVNRLFVELENAKREVEEAQAVAKEKAIMEIERLKAMYNL